MSLFKRLNDRDKTEIEYGESNRYNSSISMEGYSGRRTRSIGLVDDTNIELIKIEREIIRDENRYNKAYLAIESMIEYNELLSVTNDYNSNRCKSLRYTFHHSLEGYTLSLEDDDSDKKDDKESAGFFGTIWNAIKAIFKWIWDLITGFFKAIGRFLGLVEDKAEKTKKETDELIKDINSIKNPKYNEKYTGDNKTEYNKLVSHIVFYYDDDEKKKIYRSIEKLVEMDKNLVQSLDSNLLSGALDNSQKIVDAFSNFKETVKKEDGSNLNEKEITSLFFKKAADVVNNQPNYPFKPNSPIISDVRDTIIFHTNTEVWKPKKEALWNSIIEEIDKLEKEGYEIKGGIILNNEVLPRFTKVCSLYLTKEGVANIKRLSKKYSATSFYFTYHKSNKPFPDMPKDILPDDPKKLVGFLKSFRENDKPVDDVISKITSNFNTYTKTFDKIRKSLEAQVKDMENITKDHMKNNDSIKTLKKIVTRVLHIIKIQAMVLKSNVEIISNHIYKDRTVMLTSVNIVIRSMIVDENGKGLTGGDDFKYKAETKEPESEDDEEDK